MTIKKMTIEVGVSDPGHVVGFTQVKNFNGMTLHINPKYLKEALFALTAFDKKRDDIQIGITNKIDGGAFFIFLDEKCEMAICAMGRLEK